MKKQASAGAAPDADLSYVQRAFLPGLTGSSADRWLEATPQLFLSFNGEENGRAALARCSGFLALRSALRVVVTGPLTGRSPYTLPPACQGPERHHGGSVLLSDTLAVLLDSFSTDLISKAYRRPIKFLK